MPDFDISKLWLSPGLQSYHTDRAAHYNENNRGFGAEYNLSSAAKIAAGMFRNSLDKDSRYAGLALLGQPVSSIAGLRAGALLGGITGYPDMNRGRLAPLIAPMLTYEGNNLGLNLTALPKIGPVSPVVAAQMKVRF